MPPDESRSLFHQPVCFLLYPSTLNSTSSFTVALGHVALLRKIIRISANRLGAWLCFPESTTSAGPAILTRVEAGASSCNCCILEFSRQRWSPHRGRYRWRQLDSKLARELLQ